MFHLTSIYAKICKKVGADDKILESFLKYDISCVEAMGMFPGAYVRLKNDFKHNGANTEVRFGFLYKHWLSVQYILSNTTEYYLKNQFIYSFLVTTFSSTKNSLNSQKLDQILPARLLNGSLHKKIRQNEI